MTDSPSHDEVAFFAVSSVRDLRRVGRVDRCINVLS